MAPVTAAALNSIATNSSPDPRNAVENSLSSWSPRRDRMTPMNHRKAIPAYGNEAHRDRHGSSAGSLRQPLARFVSAGHRPVEQDDGSRQEHGEHDARDRRRSRRPKLLDESTLGSH